MTPVQRYQQLKDFWKRQVEDARATLAEASQNYEHWNNKLTEAEIMEKLAKEEDTQ